jgi:hypothetical protein
VTLRPQLTLGLPFSDYGVGRAWAMPESEEKYENGRFHGYGFNSNASKTACNQYFSCVCNALAILALGMIVASK